MHGDTAWVQVYTYEASGYERFTLDLATGALGEIPIPEDLPCPWDAVDLRGNGDVVSVGQGSIATVYDFTTGTYGPTVVNEFSLSLLSPVVNGDLFGRLTKGGGEGADAIFGYGL